jgi:radical SAM protein with 4Fe4S-binding SPASM domain
MSAETYERSLEFMYETWQRLGISVTHLTIEYVGGEVLLLSEKEINSCVGMARDFFISRNIRLIDGVQSNLIGSDSRVKNLYRLFDGRVGTSIDSFSDKRKFKGSAKKYKVFFMASEKKITPDRPAPAVFTVDADTIKTGLDEVKRAISDGRDLMVRPVFDGGIAVEMPSIGDLGDLYRRSIDEWWMNGAVRLEPFFSLLKKRLKNTQGEYPDENFDYCSFQSNCAVRSMSLEPNGDIFLCQDMADANREVMGNALNRHFNDELWSAMNRRPMMLGRDCYSCNYFKECQGGCLLKSLESGAGLYGKSDHCAAWKELFGALDSKIEATDPRNLMDWISSIDTHNDNNKNQSY